MINQAEDDVIKEKLRTRKEFNGTGNQTTGSLWLDRRRFHVDWDHQGKGDFRVVMRWRDEGTQHDAVIFQGSGRTKTTRSINVAKAASFWFNVEADNSWTIRIKETETQ